MPKATLVCLLPVRNGEADLPDYFASVARFADAVVALDDGSTDATRELLEAEPLVKSLLTNPPRPDYQGWDDAANRTRLLEAAAGFEPEWLLSLDADERIDPDDADALRAFVETEALPGYAYGFRVYRMLHDLTQYDRAGLLVYRLFAYEPGQRFPDRRLHFVPIPTSIPRRRWLGTTVRIQHVASLTEDRRRARFEKYLQADPGRAFQSSYDNLLAGPIQPKPWRPRPPNMPVLPVPEEWVTAGEMDAVQPALSAIVDRPALSAIIIARDEEVRIARSVATVVGQDCPWPFEVIVVTSGTDRTAEIVREQFPSVTLIELANPALPGEARNAGLRVARGDYVSFPGAHVELPQGSLAARLRAHDLGYAMVTGTTLNGNLTRAGWASYFLDHSAVLPGRPSTELTYPPSRCSYRRQALLAVGGFPENLRAGEDTVVNKELHRRGCIGYRAQNVRLIHYSPCRTPWHLARHHFVRGRGRGRILRDRYRERRSFLLGPIARGLLFRTVTRRLALTSRNVQAWAGDPALIAQYRRVFPLVVAGAVAAWAGTWYELLRPQHAGIDAVRLRRAAPAAVAPITVEAAKQSSIPTSHSPVIPQLAAGPRKRSGSDAGLLPTHRVLAYYGHPESTRMGVLGEHDLVTVLTKLREQAGAYVAADPTRPVIPAFELIAAIAEREPGPDGLFRRRTPTEILNAFTTFTAEHDLQLILDLQPGRNSLLEEIAAFQPWLELHHVHLALDPEWSMAERQTPGHELGSIDATTITATQEWLAALAAERGLPPKLLIVHQFKDVMIRGKASLTSLPGVQLVIDADGFGEPLHKIKAYDAIVRAQPVEYAGIKLFYQQDQPLLSPHDVLSLAPAPDLVIYQ
jgi:glycosyltransferase involved in cell wall biosynthesis